MIQSTEHGAGTKTLALGVLLAALVAAALLVATDPAHASTTFTVNSAGDQADADLDDNSCDTTLSILSSRCTLRAAIQQANHTAGHDAIDFDIPGDAAYETISPNSGLPHITDEVTIDGYSQPGASPNTKPKGNDAVLKIELNGTDVGGSESGLNIYAPNVVVRGLVINRFSGHSAGVVISGHGGCKVEGNFIGTDPSGTRDLGNSWGVYILDGSNNNTVGDSSPEARNLISGNDRDGVHLDGSGEGNKVRGNYIGTTRRGTGALGNSYWGVFIVGASNNTVGGADAASANVIAFNGTDGVVLYGNATTGNRILSNSIFSNGGLGVDLLSANESFSTDIRSPNDDKDPDTGPNTLQNKPAITSARTSSNSTTITGRLNSTPDETFVVQFFANLSGSDEGKKFIGQKTVTTDSVGRVSFTFSPAQKVPVGRAVTTTATRDDSSEFSAPRAVVAQ